MNELLDFEPKPKRKRNVWFTIYVSLMALMYLYAAIFEILKPELLQADWSYPLWLIYVFAFLCICNVLFCAMLLAWKRWGYYGLLTVKGIVFITYIFFGAQKGSFIGEIVEIAILTAFMSYLWPRFDRSGTNAK